jgi:hypothetical protein
MRFTRTRSARGISFLRPDCFEGGWKRIRWSFAVGRQTAALTISGDRSNRTMMSFSKEKFGQFFQRLDCEPKFTNFDVNKLTGLLSDVASVQQSSE